MQIGGKGIQNLLMNVALGKKTFKKQKIEKTPFHASLLWNGLNNF
jgi:hypothetical protein